MPSSHDDTHSNSMPPLLPPLLECLGPINSGWWAIFRTAVVRTTLIICVYRRLSIFYLHVALSKLFKTLWATYEAYSIC